ncbi:MAG TPA: class III extradiol ring-cleavage dioxygenase [Ramlibacter sp.]|jgi:4,5-DOPA dioxygenase extradiol|uniref:dioxygenase family protein n=1 Tax=Ramlibacter sp. TaxID=1917967 RepID=UPI002D47E9A0|nr:class III extradiol ring-cleavage dioxygenase [Ramlibacter sp.]HZY18143.1 class III extradiol ring-cleavage dioxygenase [Ramlibacter sp.]
MSRLPSLFISHGAPTFAVEPGRAGPLLRQLGQALPRPRAVLVLSPHWMTPGVRVATTSAPATIHDFGGFPRALYEIRYPAPGAPEVAARALALLAGDGWQPAADPEQGLDHGAWVPVRHLYPEADVPVLQVSMPRQLDPAGAVRLGRALAPLADEGVLLVGSGSITHNLHELRHGDGAGSAGFADEFVAWARGAVTRHDEHALVDVLRSAPHARRAHPTTEHYLPLPFAFGAATPQAPVRVIDGGMTYGTLAMDAYVFGEPARH